MGLRKSVTLVTLALLVALMSLAVGCSGSAETTEVLEADAAKGVKIAVGEQFDLVLESNATTGFEWRLVEPTTEETVKKIKNEYQEPNTGTVGAGGTDHWTFEGARAGEATIKLEYIRPWEPNAPPDRTITLKVTVTE
ncbi:MAG: protease inhibitor I42 family protein [Actinomycetota bacterium]